MFKWGISVLSKIGPIALAGYIASLGWSALGPRKPEIGPVRRDLVARLLPSIIDDIRAHRGSIYEATLLHFRNDPTDYFTDNLRRAIEQRGVLNLRDRTFAEKLRNVLHMQHPSYSELGSAIDAGRKLGSEGILYGNIRAFESYSGGSIIDVDVVFADVNAGTIIISKQYSIESAAEFEGAKNPTNKWMVFPFIKRFAWWMIVVLLLPVFTISFIRSMVSRRSNNTNAFTLCVYTIADALLAWIILNIRFGSWLMVLVLFVMVILALLYNIRVMTFALKLEE